MERKKEGEVFDEHSEVKGGGRLPQRRVDRNPNSCKRSKGGRGKTYHQKSSTVEKV
jgi:hypothetical protein